MYVRKISPNVLRNDSYPSIINLLRNDSYPSIINLLRNDSYPSIINLLCNDYPSVINFSKSEALWRRVNCVLHSILCFLSNNKTIEMS